MTSRKVVLITGILGQDGPYLAQLLLEKDYKVYGLTKPHSDPDFYNTNYLGVTENIEFIQSDMTDEGSLMKLINTVKPDEVYNLAARSAVRLSWDEARSFTDINALGVLNLLNAIRRFSPTTRFYQGSTSEMYGNANRNGFIDELTHFHPRSPYAIAKLYSYWITVNFRESYGMFCTNGILFNHESPIRSMGMLTRKITDGVARIKLGLAEEIRLENIDSKRDWGFAGDYVRAMWLILQQNEPDDFMILTGETHSIRDFVKVAFERVGINDWEAFVKIDPGLKRPTDVFSVHGKSDKAKKKLGWQPLVSFKELVNMMVDADMKRLSG
jgi:GDPmannose 4,6-dehydratase